MKVLPLNFEDLLVEITFKENTFPYGNIVHVVVRSGLEFSWAKLFCLDERNRKAITLVVILFWLY